MHRQENLGHAGHAAGLRLHPAHAAVGPVTQHRLRQIRRRMALGHYPLDRFSLAAEIVAMAGHDRAGGFALQQHTTRLLAAALDQIDTRSALLLQLEFVEQLSANEISLVMDAGPTELGRLRRSALLHLSACLDAAAAAPYAQSGPIADGGASM